jgi:hypothetical protein
MTIEQTPYQPNDNSEEPSTEQLLAVVAADTSFAHGQHASDMLGSTVWAAKQRAATELRMLRERLAEHEGLRLSGHAEDDSYAELLRRKAQEAEAELRQLFSPRVTE